MPADHVDPGADTEMFPAFVESDARARKRPSPALAVAGTTAAGCSRCSP
ncbi:MAG: hypothetical protein ACRDJ9_29780 [Dehalococcoidia bacterium]